MKVSYSEGLANHAGSESCGVAREGGAEALTGEGAGRVFSSETYTLRNADAVGKEIGCGLDIGGCRWIGPRATSCIHFCNHCLHLPLPGRDCQ